MSSYISSPSLSESAHGASRSSCHRMSSSVPSSSLVIEHFLNALTMIAGSIESHAVLTHCVTVGNDGLFRLPIDVHRTVMASYLLNLI